MKPSEKKALIKLLSEHLHVDRAQAIKYFDYNYSGKYESKEDFVKECYLETMEIPDHLKKDIEYYMDWDKMANEWFISGFFSIELPDPSEPKNTHYKVFHIFHNV